MRHKGLTQAQRNLCVVGLVRPSGALAESSHLSATQYLLRDTAHLLLIHCSVSMYQIHEIQHEYIVVLLI